MIEIENLHKSYPIRDNTTCTKRNRFTYQGGELVAIVLPFWKINLILNIIGMLDNYGERIYI